MNCKDFFLITILVAGSFTSFSQSNLLNAKEPEDIGKKTSAQLMSDNDKPLAYGFVDDRDILMSKMVWETIDLNERINFPLYFPIDTVSIGNDRRSLFHVLIEGVRKGNVGKVYADSYFNMTRTVKTVENALTFTDTTDTGKDEVNNFSDDYKSGRKVLDEMYINRIKSSSDDVSSYMIKGLWYFDKRQGELKYRLIAICPMIIEANSKQYGDNAVPIELFWIYFPSARDVLNKAYAFNDKNSSMPISFDRLLNSRRFNSVITKSENVYGDRDIDKYLQDNSQLQLLEAERLKNVIRDFEQDMWNY